MVHDIKELERRWIFFVPNMKLEVNIWNADILCQHGWATSHVHCLFNIAILSSCLPQINKICWNTCSLKNKKKIGGGGSLGKGFIEATLSVELC